MRYVTADGTKYEAQDAGDLVHQMRESSFEPCHSDAEFMAQMSCRVHLTYGRTLPTASVDDFVAELVKIGFLKIDGSEK